MPAYLKQGVGETLVIEMPFDVEQLDSFTVDIFQHGERLISITDAACEVSGHVVTASLTPDDTLLLSPQRAALCFRGVHEAYKTVIIEDIPLIIDRSPYRTPLDEVVIR